jgi:coenzyme F420-reducing hydrogenase beta subunit
LTARDAYEQVNSTENCVDKDEAKAAAVEAMREFARTSIRFNKKVDDETRVFLGLRITDTAKSSIPAPQAQCTGKTTNPGIHLVEVELTGYAILTADQRANYGVRV